ncbi:MAG: hypothetical protein ACFFAL_05630 [Promethearchaeota archaeon]
MSVILLVFAFSIALVAAAPVQAKKPLIGDMNLEFNLGWAGPSDVIPEWVGTITINEVDYGMVFFNLGTGKPFASAGEGNVLFYGEIWAIYEWVTFDFESQVLETGELILMGTDEGVLSFANSKYRMNGVVTEVGVGWEIYNGRNVHMSGYIEWQTLQTPDGPVVAPYKAPGIFRIN